MKGIRRLAVLASVMVGVFAFAAVATVGPPIGFIDPRPSVCGGYTPRVEDCFGVVPDAWDQPPAIWFVIACAVALLIAVSLWLYPVREDPTSGLPRR
jgi:hypothetical protein